MRSPSRSVRNRPAWRRPNRLVAPPGGGGPESVILRRPRSRLTAEVDLYGGTAAAARIVPGTARWPEHETVDRLIVSVSFAALTLLSTTRDLMPRIRHRIMGIAAALVEEPPDQDWGESWSECVASRRLVHPTNPGQPRIVARLVETRTGPLPTVVGTPPTSLALAAAAATLAGVALRETTTDVHLSAALSLEGVLIWCRRPEAHSGSLQRAGLEGHAYAVARLEETGRPVPEALALAAAAYRNAAS